MKTKIEMICTVRFYSVYTNDNIRIYMNTKTHSTEANNEFGSSEICLRIHDKKNIFPLTHTPLLLQRTRGHYVRK